MSIQLNIASTTMRELQKKIDNIANNIANVNTIGYKSNQTNFSDALVLSIEKQVGNKNEVGRLTPYGLRIGMGTKASQTSINTTQGSFQQTGRELDFAIQGNNSYFRVSSEGKIYYTRDGSFQVQPVLNSNQVALVTSNGDYVLDMNNEPIVFDNDFKQIYLNPNGTLQITYNNPNKETTNFQLSLALVDRPNLLERMGSNKFSLNTTETEAVQSGILEIVSLNERNDGSLAIQQGMLEMSNVDLTEEMTELISTQRLLQSQSRALTIADDMLGLTNSMRS